MKIQDWNQNLFECPIGTPVNLKCESNDNEFTCVGRITHRNGLPFPEDVEDKTLHDDFFRSKITGWNM